MENLIKALADEVDLTQDAVHRLHGYRKSGRRALEIATDAEVDMQFEKLKARVQELRKVLGL